MIRTLIAVTVASLGLAASSCSRATPGPRTFATPEEAVRALTDVVKAEKLDDLLAIFGPDGKELIASSDAATARGNRKVFTVAVAEKWHLVDQGANTKVLVIGNEEWPFPVPLVHDANGWRFDTAAGKEEVVARRIGRNELAVMQICRTYVAAQYHYAHEGHDGKRAGLYATAFRSSPGKQNGLYWEAGHGQKRSPLGDLVAQAAEEGRSLGKEGRPEPFHGYYFKILTSQGAAATGGAKNYVTGGDMSGGFALVAWPAQYDATGVMTFIVNQDGVLYEKDLGPDTASAAKAISVYDPDSSWAKAQ
jgi:hypothetical protein